MTARDEDEIVMATPEQIAAWNAERFAKHGEPWGVGKTDAEIEAEAERRVVEWETKRDAEKVRTHGSVEAANVAADAEFQERLEAGMLADLRADLARLDGPDFARAMHADPENEHVLAERDARLAGGGQAAADDLEFWSIWLAEKQRVETESRAEAKREEFETFKREHPSSYAETWASNLDDYKKMLGWEQVEHEAAVAKEAARLRIQKEARDRIRAEEAEAAPPLVVRTRAEIAALKPPSFVWEGWLYSSTPAEIAAPGGVGKTALILGVAVATFHALPLLGSFTRQGRTLYIAGEGERALDLRIRAWEKHLKVAEGSTEIDIIYGTKLNPATLPQLAAIVSAGQYQLVIADTFSALMGAEDENSNAEAARLIDGFKSTVLAANPEATPVILHHVTETTNARGIKTQKARGASTHRDNHDTVILLSGSADSFVMSTEATKAGKQKDAAPRTLDGLALRKVGPHVVVVLQEEAERAAHADQLRRLIELMVPGSGYTSTELQGKWSLTSNKGLYQALRTEAVTAGLIVKGEGNKGRYVRPKEPTGFGRGIRSSPKGDRTTDQTESEPAEVSETWIGTSDDQHP